MRQRTVTDRAIDGVAVLDEDGAAGQVKGGRQPCFRERKRQAAERPPSAVTLDPDDEDLEMERGEQEVGVRATVVKAASRTKVSVADSVLERTRVAPEPVLHGGSVDEGAGGLCLEGLEGGGDRSRTGWLRHVHVPMTAEEQAGLEGVVETA